MVYRSKRQQPHWDENVSSRPSIGLQWTMRKPSYLRAGCSWPQNIIKHRHSERVAHIYSSNIRNKLKVKMKYDIQRLEIPDFGTGAKCGGVKLLWCDYNPPPLKFGHCGNHITQLNTPKNLFKKVWVLCYNGNKGSHSQIQIYM